MILLIFLPNATGWSQIQRMVRKHGRQMLFNLHLVSYSLTPLSRDHAFVPTVKRYLENIETALVSNYIIGLFSLQYSLNLKLSPKHVLQSYHYFKMVCTTNLPPHSQLMKPNHVKGENVYKVRRCNHQYSIKESAEQRWLQQACQGPESTTYRLGWFGKYTTPL